MKKILFSIAIMLMAISGCRMSAYASIDVDQELSFDLEITNQTNR